MLVKPPSWDSIELHFLNLKSYGWKVDSMLSLLSHIVNSQLSQRLFAYTSLDILVIGIYDPMEADREALHVKLDQNALNWIFRYFAKPFEGY